MKKLLDYRLKGSINTGVFIEAGNYYEELSDYINNLGTVRVNDINNLHKKDYIYLYHQSGSITGRENYSKEEYDGSYKGGESWNHIKWEDIRHHYVPTYDVDEIMSNLDKLEAKYDT